MLVGAFAEEAVLAATAVRPIPADVDRRSAAAFGVAHRTAYHVLRSVGACSRERSSWSSGPAAGWDWPPWSSAPSGRHRHGGGVFDREARGRRVLRRDRLVNHRTAGLREQLRDILPAVPTSSSIPWRHAGRAALRTLRWRALVTVGYAAGDIPRIPLNSSCSRVR